MRKIFDFGKFPINGNRKINLITVDVRLDKTFYKLHYDTLERIEETYTFSASGDIWNATQTDIISGGQNLDKLNNYLKENDTFKTIYEMWQKYHLNDIKNGTKAQGKAVKEYLKTAHHYNYYDVCEHLESKGLLYDRGFKYGTNHLLKPIEEVDLITIKSLLEGDIYEKVTK